MEELVVKGEVALKVADALTSTTTRILQLLSKEKLDISTTAKRLGMSEGYISEQARILEELGLIKVNYEKGKKGIRKICQLQVSKITFLIESD
ncbi:MAG: hypothetical protein QG670_365 [Thermoproteota archaeon]|nr:hypothetical protein [Thermoproteota archaeon]